MTRSLAAFCIALSLAVTAFAITVPYLSGPVVDEARLLDEPARARLEALLRRIDASGKAQMAVLIAASLQDTDIESYSMAVAEKWKLGKKGSDRGVLLVIAPRERKMRLEVGYGLEGDITDLESKRLLADQVASYFREGAYADGIAVAIGFVAKKTGVDLDTGVSAPPVTAKHDDGISPWLLLLIIFIVFVGFLQSGRRRALGYRDDTWGGGGWGGGGGGFGGGSSGGGGFSGGGGGFGGGGSSSGW